MPPATFLILDVCGEYSSFNKLSIPITVFNFLLNLNPNFKFITLYPSVNSSYCAKFFDQMYNSDK